MSLLNYVHFVLTCLTWLRALICHVPPCLVLTCLYIFFVPTCLRALNYFVPTCTHFSRTYVSKTTQDLGTDIYQADVKSDEN